MTTTTWARPITRPQLLKLMALFRDVDRDARLERISLLVSRRVTTANDMSCDEASLVIDRLEREQERPAW